MEASTVREERARATTNGAPSLGSAASPLRMLGIDEDKVNVNGGAIALGHPIGASGARILTALMYELRRRGGGRGCAAICSGGGQGDAIIVEVNGS